MAAVRQKPSARGLSLIWTGAGYLPKVRPIVGVPTYALIAGILACRTCREAISLMRRTLNAGSFIFCDYSPAHRQNFVAQPPPAVSTGKPQPGAAVPQVKKTSIPE